MPMMLVMTKGDGPDAVMCVRTIAALRETVSRGCREWLSGCSKIQNVRCWKCTVELKRAAILFLDAALGGGSGG